MTYNDVVAAANRGNIAPGQMKLHTTLRSKVIPKFLRDVDAIVGDVWWRRNITTVTILATTNNIALPDDFLHAFKVAMSGSGSFPGEVQYIGDDTDAMLLAALGTSVRPGYWVQAHPTTGAPKFYYSSTVAVNTAFGIAYKRGVGASLSEAAAITAGTDDLRVVLPVDLQWALVHDLRAHILAETTTAGDDRISIELAEYDRILKALKTGGNAESGNSQRTVSAR